MSLVTDKNRAKKPKTHTHTHTVIACPSCPGSARKIDSKETNEGNASTKKRDKRGRRLPANGASAVVFFSLPFPLPSLLRRSSRLGVVLAVREYMYMYSHTANPWKTLPFPSRSVFPFCHPHRVISLDGRVECGVGFFFRTNFPSPFFHARYRARYGLRAQNPLQAKWNDLTFIN